MNSEDKVVVALSTCPNQQVAEQIAEALVGERLASCVNCLPGAASTYRWSGAVQKDTETLLIIKTVEGRLDAIKSRVKQLHPYELPELIAIPVCAGNENYLAWVRDSVK